jgi:hypothetical protein
MDAKESLWTIVAAQADDLLQLVRQKTPKGPLDISPPHVHILGMFWRALRLYDGVLLLLKAELPEEAAFLARSLFEESLRLRQLEEDSQDRDALILQWANRSIDQKRGLMEVARRLGLDSDPEIDGIVAALDRDRDGLQKRARRHGITKFRPFRSVRDASVRFDRKKEYWIYEWAHESVHGTDAAWLYGRRRTAENEARLYAKTSDPGLRAGFAAFAARSMIDAMEATSKIFGWPVLPELSVIFSGMERALHDHTEQP